MSSSSNPSPAEIIALAKECGFKERRPTASATLFFIETSPAHGMPPVRINIYPTTRSIMTHLNHPTMSTNELWRSNAYDNLAELRTFLENPRIHTGKGYRNAEKAVRGCVECGDMKPRTDFSSNQWRKGPDANKCKDCVNKLGAAARVGEGVHDAVVPDLATSLQKIKLEPSDTPARLTEDALKSHNTETAASNKNVKQELERRQFNCPQCPKHGRGKFIFFKKVPVYKPLVKCPQCKQATQGKCQRLYPIPRDSEKGYGLYRCHVCRDHWGSSRAVAAIGQECFTCREQGRPSVMVTPFRLEVLKKKKKGAGDGRKMRRVPKEPIRENETDEREYTVVDRRRNASGAANALVGGGGTNDATTRSYDYQYSGGATGDSPEAVSSSSAPDKNRRIPAGYQHKCAACATGACKSRRLPKSEIHDVSDGNTVSTRASVATNSSVDKSEFVDRDEDFSGFFSDDDDDDDDGKQH